MVKQLFIAFSVLVSVNLHAQIQITWNGVQYQGDTLVFNGSSGDSPVNNLQVKNLSGVQLMNSSITRLKLIDLSGTGDQLCWGNGLEGICYPENMMSPYNPWTTPAGGAIDIPNGDSSLLVIDYFPHYMAGVSHYRYYVLDNAGNKLDSIDAKYTTTSQAGLEENSQLTLSVYPNPAKGSISVKTGYSQGLDIKIVDMLGTVVYSNKLENATDKIDVSDYTDGIYFITIGNGNKSSMVTKKIIVRN